MCGRYDDLIAREAYKTMYKAIRLPAWNFPPRYNMFFQRRVTQAVILSAGIKG